MPIRKIKKKTVKKPYKKSRINKRNVEFYIFALKIYKIFKIILTIVLFSIFIYLSATLYKNKSFKRLYEQFGNMYSYIFYKNICSNVNIHGVNRSNIDNIEQNVYEYCSKSDNKNDLNKLLNNLKSDPWVKNLTIRRKLPDSLKIDVEEFLPFALWKNNNKLLLIDENGTVINIDEREIRGYYNLLIVAGDSSKENIYSLFNLLSSNPNLFFRIKSAMMISKRRWNLELDNGIIIKMPEKNILDAWFKLDKILSINGSEIGLKVIDLRNSDKIFLEENK